MSKPIRLSLVLIGAALLLPACGSGTPAIPPVEPVVQPLPQEGLFGEESASDSSSLDDTSGASDKGDKDKESGETKSDTKSTGSDSATTDTDSTKSETKPESSDTKSDTGKPKGRTKYSKRKAH